MDFEEKHLGSFIKLDSLLHGHYGFINSSSKTTKEILSLIKKLEIKDSLIQCDNFNKNRLYLIKKEKVEPKFGIGTEYYSHYLIPKRKNQNIDSIQNIFKLHFELEEKHYYSEKISKDWYYSISHHFSD